MDRDGMHSINGGSPLKSATSVLQPNYSDPAVKEALQRLASIDLIELCNEAKVERCRATRDLRSCGRYVQYILKSCGHASLCAECSQRCDICPICRVPIQKSSAKLQLRLYYECIDAGLISKKLDERFQENEEEEEEKEEEHLDADVQRLYSLFDVAMENNLVSLICHYVTDVCMDESAVSSDPVTAILLDEVVVKDWCKRTFRNIVGELRLIYNLVLEEMKTRLNVLLKFLNQLAGLSSVLEVLESSFRGTLSAQLQDLHHLQESILRTKQHLEIMIWCIRHQFLENVRSRYANFTEWTSQVRERKSAAIKRSWPDAVDQSSESTNQSSESTRLDGSLFIEDALANLEIEQDDKGDLAEEEIEVASLQKNEGYPYFRSRIEGLRGCYPFENLRSAADMLFLNGSSDMALAKKATFLYYLFDRHWTLPDKAWRHIIDDFAAAFSIARYSLLESLVFYLLDDHTDEALLEACRLLPEISGPATHTKIPHVLLERHHPDLALMVLRWSGLDGGSQILSLSQAVTAVRVRVECGLLTEAFTYQRMLCTRVRETKLKFGPSAYPIDSKGDCKNWVKWVETLVTEICCLCIRRNLVDRMIELPWNSDEEKCLRKCLLEYAIDDPSATIGSLLVVYYLQRYRYIEAYQVDHKLQHLEQDFKSNNSVSEEILNRMDSASHWRAGLVDKCLSLLPEVQQQQVKSGKSPEFACTFGEADEIQAKSNLSEQPEPKSASLLIFSSTTDADNNSKFLKPTSFETPVVTSQSINNPRFSNGGFGPTSILQDRFFSTAEKGPKSRFGFGNGIEFDNISTLMDRSVGPLNATPSREITRSLVRVLQNSPLVGKNSEKLSPNGKNNGFVDQLRSSTSPYSRRVTANPETTPSSLIQSSAQEKHHNSSVKRFMSDRDSIPGIATYSDDALETSGGIEDKALYNKDRNTNPGPRWRSDETSDEEQGRSPVLAVGSASISTTKRTRRSRRLAKR